MNELYIKKVEENTRKFDEGLKRLKDLNNSKNNGLVFESKKYDDSMILPEYMVTSIEVKPGVFLLYHTAYEDINLNDGELKVFGVFNSNSELLYRSDDYHNSYIDVEKSKYYSKYSIKELTEDLRNMLELSVIVYIKGNRKKLCQLGEDVLEDFEANSDFKDLTYTNLNNLTWYIQREFMKFIDEKEEDGELDEIVISYIIDEESNTTKGKTITKLLSEFLEEYNYIFTYKEIIAYNFLQFQKDKK